MLSFNSFAINPTMPGLDQAAFSSLKKQEVINQYNREKASKTQSGQICKIEKRKDKIHLLKNNKSVYSTKDVIYAAIKLNQYVKVGLCSVSLENCFVVKIAETGEEVVYLKKDILIKSENAEESLIFYQKEKLCSQNGVQVGDYSIADQKVRNLSIRYTKEEAKKKFGIVN